ncbi:M20/M25/M40 family metallo-hydrolase [Acidaminobacterium chupaoyuni]|mgnify:CR=1 FL=1
MLSFIETFRQLLAAASPSGYEAPCGEVIARLAAPYCDEITTDALGNVIAHKKGSGMKIMVPTHMDVIGFMVTGVDKDGMLSVTNVGGHAPARLAGKAVRFANGIKGLLCARQDASMGDHTPAECKMQNLYIDIGSTDEKESRAKISVGDIAVYDAGAEELTDGKLMSPYCDNLASCAVSLCAMSCLEKTDNDLYFVFTVQEEVGLNGARTAAFAIEPQMGICVDLTKTGDCPANDTMEVALGKGPAIKIKDSSVICSPQVIARLEKAAAQQQISCQREVLTGGGTDTFAMLISRCGVPSGCISLPGRYIHSQNETIAVKDAEAAAKLLACAVVMQ